jgi:type II secretory pathway pseudopilin PulG
MVKLKRTREGTRALAPLPGCPLKQGFTLIEVIIAITILFLVIGSIFYYYSQVMENQAKLKEKYRILRIAREFVDSMVFSNDTVMLAMTEGKSEIEDFQLRWHVYPVEDGREVLFTSGILPLAQLKRVHLEIIKKGTGKSVLDLHFLLNTISSPTK